jgi:hypothetical protein
MMTPPFDEDNDADISVGSHHDGALPVQHNQIPGVDQSNENEIDQHDEGEIDHVDTDDDANDDHNNDDDEIEAERDKEHGEDDEQWNNVNDVELPGLIVVTMEPKEKWMIDMEPGPTDTICDLVNNETTLTFLPLKVLSKRMRMTMTLRTNVFSFQCIQKPQECVMR